MSIAPQIHRFAPELSPRQLEVVGHVDGPLRVVAGPGAGKTRTLTWRPSIFWPKMFADRRNCYCWHSANRLLRR